MSETNSAIQKPGDFGEVNKEASYPIGPDSTASVMFHILKR
jgi:hypothetical protein